MPSPLKTRFILVVCLLASVLSLPQRLRAQSQPSFLSFQVPGSRATYPLSINEAETVTGYYISNSGVTGGFLRYQDGQIVTFNVPGSIATIPVSINTAGYITGYYNLPSKTPVVFDIPQGFVRTPDGKFTTFGNPVTTASSSSFWAQPVSINVAGEIIGNFPDVALASVVFLRSAAGVVLTFSLGLGAHYSTVATGLNQGGAIVGYSSSQSLNLAQGFLWSGQGPPPNPGGGFTPITVAGSTGTFPTGINAHGTIVGCYAAGGIYHYFVRAHDGVVKTLYLPGTVPDCIAAFTPGFIAVVPQPILVNDQGTIIGYTTTAAQIATAFIRLENGVVTTFNYPGSMRTIPTSINNCEVITGYYSRGQEILGFIREP
jgi:hypothetical protein